MKKKISIAGPELHNILKSSNAKEQIHSIFENMHPFEIYSLIEDLDIFEIGKIIEYIRFPKASDIFEYFDDDDREEIFKTFNRSDMITMIEEMSSDDRVDLVKSLDKNLVDTLMPLIAQVERNDIKRLIKYDEGTAGSIMTTEYATLREGMTAKEGLSHLKKIAPDRETIYSIYITDNERIIKGVLSLKALIIAKDNQLIRDIMNSDFIFVNVNDDQEPVSKIIADYDLLAVPVVDKSMRLFGIITVDDIVDVVIEEDTEDFLRHGSVEGEADYLDANPFRLAKQRIVWLLLLVIVGFVSGYIMQLKESVLHSVIALTFFLPLLNGSAGNAGTQSSTIIIRGLATGQIKFSDVKIILLKEISIGIILGILLGLAAGLRAIILNNDFRLAITVSISMVTVVTLANILGALFPLLFKKLKLDPALMSAPFIASIVDILSIFIYLSLAGYIFKV